jgi:competence protein ComEA
MKIVAVICIAASAVGCAGLRHAEDPVAPQSIGVANQSNVAEAMSISVTIAGEVARPGVYSLPAGSRVLDAISRAGGFTDDAYAQGVRVRRKGGETLLLDLRGAESGCKQDFVLEDGEVVAVPRWMRPVI